MDDFSLTVIMPLYNQPKLFAVGLNSIPALSRIEIVVVDDGSTDASWANLCRYCDNHPNKHIVPIHFDENRGVSAAINTGLDAATGEYVVFLASDGDYFLPGVIYRALKEWFPYKYDLIYYDVIDKNKHIRHLTPKTTKKYVGSVKFMRRKFIGKTRCPLERRRAEDVIFSQALLAKNPREYFTNTLGKFYNYPREGSLTWNARHGITDSIGNPLHEN